eukprot:1158027-Pelagomonas_calceolata.AAC.1
MGKEFPLPLEEEPRKGTKTGAIPQPLNQFVASFSQGQASWVAQGSKKKTLQISVPIPSQTTIDLIQGLSAGASDQNPGTHTPHAAAAAAAAVPAALHAPLEDPGRLAAADHASSLWPADSEHGNWLVDLPLGLGSLPHRQAAEGFQPRAACFQEQLDSRNACHLVQALKSICLCQNGCKAACGSSTCRLIKRSRMLGT